VRKHKTKSSVDINLPYVWTDMPVIKPKLKVT